MKNGKGLELESCLIINNKNMSQILSKPRTTLRTCSTRSKLKTSPKKPKASNKPKQNISKKKSKNNSKIESRQKSAFLKHTQKRFSNLSGSLRRLLSQGKFTQSIVREITEKSRLDSELIDKQRNLIKKHSSCAKTIDLLAETRSVIKANSIVNEMKVMKDKQAQLQNLSVISVNGYSFDRSKEFRKMGSISKTGFSYCYTSKDEAAVNDQQNPEDPDMGQKPENELALNFSQTEKKNDSNCIDDFTQDKSILNDPNLYTFAENENSQSKKEQILKEIQNLDIKIDDTKFTRNLDSLSCNQSVIFRDKNGSTVVAEVELEELFEYLVLR